MAHNPRCEYLLLLQFADSLLIFPKPIPEILTFPSRFLQYVLSVVYDFKAFTDNDFTFPSFLLF